MQDCQEYLISAGFEKPLSDLHLRPGVDRSNVVEFLLERLLHPSSLSSVLSKLEEVTPPPTKTSDEEWKAQRLASLLRLMGMQTSPDLVRGCGVSPSESLGFLFKLVSLVRIKETSAAAALVETADAVNESGMSDGVTLSKLQPMKNGISASASHAQLLEFACSNFSQLASENCQQSLPSDIAKASTKHSVFVDELLTSCQAKLDEFAIANELLSLQTQELSKQTSQVGEEKWTSMHNGLVSGLREYLSSIATFSDVYTKELGVWSESLPPAKTCEIGQKADSMLRSYRHVAATLESLNTIRGLREALVASKQPLKSYRPDVLNGLAEKARLEASALAKQVEVLRRAAINLKEDERLESDQQKNADGVLKHPLTESVSMELV